MLANLQLFPTNPTDFEYWSFSQQDHIARVNDAISTQQNIELESYELYPISQQSWLNWLQLHQKAHNDINSVLGTPGNDLSGLNLKDAKEVQAWVFLDFAEHQQWANKLGVY